MLDSSGIKWQFWLLWVLASACAGAAIALVARAAAYTVGYAVGETGGTVIGEAALGLVALGGFIGAIGIAQWLVMMRLVPWAAWWILANAVSGAMGGAVILAVRAALLPMSGEAVAGIAGVVTGLTTFGISQWLVLFRQVPWAGRLAIASVVGLIGAVVSSAVFGGLAGSELASGGGFGAGYGAITGGALIFFGSRAAKTNGAEQSIG